MNKNILHCTCDHNSVRSIDHYDFAIIVPTFMVIDHLYGVCVTFMVMSLFLHLW